MKIRSEYVQVVYNKNSSIVNWNPPQKVKLTVSLCCLYATDYKNKVTIRNTTRSELKNTHN